jgi:hypothetical protein
MGVRATFFRADEKRPFLRHRGALNRGQVESATSLINVARYAIVRGGAILACCGNVGTRSLERGVRIGNRLCHLLPLQRFRSEMQDVVRAPCLPDLTRVAARVVAGNRIRLGERLTHPPTADALWPAFSAMPLSPPGPYTPLDLSPHRLRRQVDAPSGHSRSRVRLGAVAPAPFPVEFFDLYPAVRSRMALVRGPSGHPGRLPDADCRLRRRHCPQACGAPFRRRGPRTMGHRPGSNVPSPRKAESPRYSTDVRIVHQSASFCNCAVAPIGHCELEG